MAPLARELLALTSFLCRPYFLPRTSTDFLKAFVISVLFISFQRPLSLYTQRGLVGDAPHAWRRAMSLWMDKVGHAVGWPDKP